MVLFLYKILNYNTTLHTIICNMLLLYYGIFISSYIWHLCPNMVKGRKRQCKKTVSKNNSWNLKFTWCWVNFYHYCMSCFHKSQRKYQLFERHKFYFIIYAGVYILPLLRGGGSRSWGIPVFRVVFPYIKNLLQIRLI